MPNSKVFFATHHPEAKSAFEEHVKTLVTEYGYNHVSLMQLYTSFFTSGADPAQFQRQSDQRILALSSQKYIELLSEYFRSNVAKRYLVTGMQEAEAWGVDAQKAFESTFKPAEGLFYFTSK